MNRTPFPVTRDKGYQPGSAISAVPTMNRCNNPTKARTGSKPIELTISPSEPTPYTEARTLDSSKKVRFYTELNEGEAVEDRLIPPNPTPSRPQTTTYHEELALPYTSTPQNTTYFPVNTAKVPRLPVDVSLLPPPALTTTGTEVRINIRQQAVINALVSSTPQAPLHPSTVPSLPTAGPCNPGMPPTIPISVYSAGMPDLPGRRAQGFGLV